MSAIDPYESPSRTINRQNRMDRLIGKTQIARENPGYGAPAPGNWTGPNVSGPGVNPNRWENFFNKTSGSSGVLSPAQQAAAVNASMRQDRPMPKPIDPLAGPAQKVTPMAAARYNVTNPRTGQKYGQAEVSDANVTRLGGKYPNTPTRIPTLPKPQPISANSGRIVDETGDRTAEFSEQSRMARTMRPINPLATTKRRPRTI